MTFLAVDSSGELQRIQATRRDIEITDFDGIKLGVIPGLIDLDLNGDCVARIDDCTFVVVRTGEVLVTREAVVMP